MRSTGDLIVLAIAVTLCTAVLLFGVGLVIIAVVSPEQDVSLALAAVTGLLNTMLGLLAGYLIGRTRVGTNGH